MTLRLNTSDQKWVISGETISPFVGQNEPLVGHMQPHVLPFVGRKLPFVTNRGNQRGFTLVELAITMLIAAIMMAWGVSSWKNLIMDNRMVSQANDLMAELTLARSEAIKRRRNVMVCSSSTLTGCAGTTNWAQGWIIFEDTNKNGAVDGGEPILRVHEQLTGGNTLTPGAGISTGFRYDRLGLAEIKIVSAGDNEFQLCDTRANSFGRKIQLSATGRPSIQRGC